MGLGMTVTTGDGKSMSFNSGLSPLGLFRWMDENIKEPSPWGSLYEICSRWTYAASKDIKKAEFRSAIMWYKDKLDLLRGPTYFRLNFRQYVSVADGLVTNGKCHSKVLWEGPDMLLPTEYYNGLEYYKRWFGDLVTISELLQSPGSVYYCDN